MVKEINGETIYAWGCAIFHLLYCCFHFLHGYGLHERMVVLIVDQKKDVLDHLVHCSMMGIVQFQEELIEMPG